jgi:hypothetical protein
MTYEIDFIATEAGGWLDAAAVLCALMDWAWWIELYPPRRAAFCCEPRRDVPIA